MIKIYIDAATDQNKGISAGGMVFIQDKLQRQIHHSLSAKKNNEAEFEMMLFALVYLQKNKLFNQIVFIYSDSRIVVQSIEKKYVKDEQFNSYLKKILQLKELFNLLFIEWIEEKQNKGADRLAKQALQKVKHV